MLKDGLKWSDGSDMTAEDVVFTWRYCTDEATGCTASEVFAGRPACNLADGPTHYRSATNNECRDQDIAGANRLLDENGVLDGDGDGDGIREYRGVPLRISYMTSTNSIRQATQVLVRDWWQQIGIATELIDFDAAVCFGGDPVEDAEQTYRRFFADAQMYATEGGIEPQISLSDGRCDQIPNRDNNWGAGNIARACNPEYDAAYEPLPQLPLGPQRQALVKRLNDILVQSYVEIPLVSRGLVSAHGASLQGVRFNAWDSELWNIAEWRR